MGEHVGNEEQATAATPTAEGSVQGRILQVLRDGQANAAEMNRSMKRIVDALDRRVAQRPAS